MLERGRVFAGHRIEAVAGSGGMGVVYRARNLALDSVRALKILPSGLSRDPAFEARFRRESRLAASIEHPNVIPIHDAGEEDGLLFLAMRYVDGTDLKRQLERDGRLGPGPAVAVAEQVAAALDAAHDRGLVHRDVKPANVLLEGERAYLTDFGISKVATAETDLTATGEFMGTVDYVAPEQIEGRAVDGRADVYALACVIHEALTGAPPFRRDTQLATLFAHANAPRPLASASVPELPGALDRVLAKGMATDPAARYESAWELVAAVRDALGGEETRPFRATRFVRPLRFRWRPLAAAAGVAAVAAVIAIVALSGGDDEPSEAGPAPEATATVPVGPDSTHLAVGEGSVWAPSVEQGRLYEVDARRERRGGAPIRVGAKPLSAAVGFGSVWVVGGGQAGSTWRVGPSNRSVSAEIRVGSRPSDVAVGEGGVWLTNEGDDRVQRVDPAAGSSDVESVPVGQVPRAVAVGEGGVWVTNVDDGTVSQIDPETVKTVGTPIEAGQRPSDIAAGAGSVWAMDNFNGEVTRIDPGTARRVGDPIAVGNKPRGIAVGLGYVWVANGGDDSVVRIDPGSGEVVGSPIAVGDEPADIAIGDGAVWTVNFGDATVSRIEP